MDAVERARKRLQRREQMLARLEELNAPELILENQRQQLETAKAKLQSALAGVSDPGTPVAPLAFEPPPAVDEVGLEVPPSCLYFGDQVLVCDARETHLGEMRWPSLNLILFASDGKRVFYRHGHFTSHHLFDVSERRWLSSPAGGLPRGLMREEHEQAFVVDVSALREWQAEELADYPETILSSPDGRHLFIADKEGSGGIYEVGGGNLVWEAVPERLPLAFVAGERGFRLFPDRKLRVRGAQAAAFHASGRRVAVLTKKGLVIRDC
jgi:hypothetical protein